MAPNPFKNMPASKKPPVVVATQAPVILAEQPAAMAPAQVRIAPMRRIPMRAPAPPSVVVATPAPVRMETHDEFKARTLRENLAASAAAAEAVRQKQQKRDFGSRPAVNVEPAREVATDDELATAAEESMDDVAEAYSQDHEEEERDVIVAEASDPQPARASEPVTVAEKYRRFRFHLTSDQPLEVFYDEDGRMRVVADSGIVGAGGRALTAEEAYLIPCRTNGEREVRSLQCDLLGTPVRELDTRRIPAPSGWEMVPSKSKIGHPPPRRFLPPSSAQPSSGLMSSRVGILPVSEGRPPMAPLPPRSPPATGRDE